MPQMNTMSDVFTESDIFKIGKEFDDSDDSDEGIPLCPINYESVMICSKCGGNFLPIDNVLICDNQDCRMISEHSYEDIILISNTMQTVRTISIEQRKQIYKELELMNKIAEQVGVLPLPKEVIDATVELFAQLKNCRPETRNKKRRQLEGSCIYLTCIGLGLMRTKKDIQLLCGLTDRNLTTTIGEIEMEINKGNIKLEQKYDIRDSGTNSICMKIGIPSNVIPQIIDDVRYILEIVSDNMLVSSNFDSKLLSAIFIAIRVSGYNVNLKHICNISIINSETVMNIINICIDNMHLFDRFSYRCEQAEEDLLKQQDNVTQKDIKEYIINTTRNR